MVLQRIAQRKPLRCVHCGKEMSLPEELQATVTPPAPVPTRLLGRCPACLKPAQATGTPPVIIGTCVTCSLSFRCEGPGRGSFDFPVETPATPEELEPAVALLARRPSGALLGLALRRRLERGALPTGEAAMTVALLDALATWRGVGAEPVIPLPPPVVLHLLGPIALGAQSASVDEARGVVHLRASLTLDQSPGLSPGSRLALNGVGIGLLLATGTGFTVRGGDPAPPETVTNEQWLAIDTSPQGSSLRGLAAQNQAPPQPIAREELVALVQRVFERRAMLERYVRLLALTGPRLRGAPARRVSREAVVQRLLDVGASPADATRAADAFVVDPTR